MLSRRDVLLLGLTVIVGGCAGPVTSLYPPTKGAPAVSIWVVDHGWHTGVMLPWETVPSEIWPEREDFTGASYLEVGWGDRDFYQAREPTVGLALKATFWPTASALHVAAFDRPPASVFPSAEIVELRLTPQGFARLCAFISDAYAKDTEGRAIPLGTGWYGVSQFYQGRESYFLTTCNVWTARALRSAGLPVSPVYALTAGNVMFQARRAQEVR